MELDAEDNLHAGLVGLDVEAVADCTKVGNVDLDGVADFDKVVRGEAPHDIVGVGFDDDRKLDLALELVDLGRVLSLCDGVLVPGDVLDKEAMLGEDSHAFSSITKVVVAKVDSTSVERHARGEALVLDKVSMIHVKAGSVLTSFIWCWMLKSSNSESDPALIPSGSLVMNWKREMKATSFSFSSLTKAPWK
jgi:hypothetical protein